MSDRGERERAGTAPAVIFSPRALRRAWIALTLEGFAALRARDHDEARRLIRQRMEILLHAEAAGHSPAEIIRSAYATLAAAPGLVAEALDANLALYQRWRAARRGLPPAEPANAP